jgi:hypothetical protein
MTNKNLENLARTGSLKQEPPAEAEITGLINSGVARLEDSKNINLSMDSRFDLAYNAAHALSLAALRIKGYRSENRYMVFQCLKHTLDLPNEQWRVLDEAHRKRNIAEYEGGVDLTRALIDALIEVTDEVAKRVARIASADK